MPTPALSDKTIQRTLEALRRHDGNVSAAARELGISRATVKRHRQIGEKSGLDAPDDSDEIAFPVFPDEDIEVERIIDHMSERFEKRAASHAAHTWFPVKFRTNDPVGVLWFGDPHVDDNGCNWTVLRRHTELCRTTPGLYGANIGDTTNNWAGRLASLYAKQDTSVKTARRLAEWFMFKSGVDWLVWLLGNHDQWGDGSEVLARMAKQFGTRRITCHDWEARFRLVFPNGWERRIYAAHDFPGHSQWNPLHGPMKEGMMGNRADLYVCGHKHNWATFSFENPGSGDRQHFIRVRGYKFMDDYARRIGKHEQHSGCAVLSVFDPHDETTLVFDDVEAGAGYLTFLRSRKEAA